ncbi:sugar-specific transcriptional regulator TrmB [Streptomyces sp. T12]|uniref:helix-turn-helix transcriptional regulator n=1 Tax=Streptomyces sp. T12 TaxID=477697 RepID=UPI0011A0D365|nr:helix-turn-helix transcriptional regulator [Streptomyces sp. T12]TWD17613.1 sugar-specific transcriptional regulator TrmB [Streptomyces sp. T12]
MTLEVAGLSTAEETVYRLLVAEGEVSVEDLVLHCKGMDRATVEAALSGLTSQGLASRSEETPHLVLATPPEVALVPRLKRQSEALDFARVEVAALVDTYQNSRRKKDTSHLIEVITGAEPLKQHLQHIQSATQHEMLWFCKPHYVAMPAGSNQAEFEALSRGVRYRVLYEKEYFDDEGAMGNVAKAVGAGEIARGISRLPLRLAIADQSIAVCPLVPGGPNGSPEIPTAALIRDSSLLAALVALFERFWEDGVPLDADSSGSAAVTGTGSMAMHDPLSARDRRMLSLLVAGVADKSIATQMQLSRRTVQRDVQRMMRLAGATTRTQLAWQASRRNWL